MVHDTNATDMWYHDTLVELSILHMNYLIKEPRWRDELDNADPQLINEYDGSKFVEVDHNPEKLSMIVRRVRSVENQSAKVLKHCKEMVILNQYRYSKGLIPLDARDSVEAWYNQMEKHLNIIITNYRAFLHHKELSPDEWNILVQSIKSEVDLVREMIRDAYTFERAQDEKQRENEIRDVMGT
jgi:hypothetical protein